MTTDLNALLRAVITNPDEDTPRLMYADAIQERAAPGDAEYAEFIRVQVAMARCADDPECTAEGLMECGCSDPECPWLVKENLKERERSLWNLQTKGGAWVINLDVGVATAHHYLTTDAFASAPPNPSHSPRMNWSRGFVSEVIATAADWLAIADALIWHPSQTVKCPVKGCDNGTIGRPRPGDIGGQWLGRMCDRCEGSGTIPRECPDTAQPIRKVTFTTEPRETGHLNAFALWKKMEHGEPWRSYRWPGIVFERPH